MRVYHFLFTDWALDDIAKRRIRISEIDQLNDPFELWCVSTHDKNLRVTALLQRRELPTKGFDLPPLGRGHGLLTEAQPLASNFTSNCATPDYRIPARERVRSE
jgi:hypothetical protein